MPLILPARTLDSGYDIDNSLRMGPSGGGTTPHVNLRRTLGSAGTEEKFTYSCWVKISAKLEYNFWLLGGSQETSSPNQTTFFRISSDGKLRLSDGSVNLNTNRLFRDPSAWYHIVLAVDSTQGTDSNRVKIYVNGVQETSFANETYPSQNLAFRVLENGVTQSIGTWLDDSGTAYACDDGYISEVYLIDGAQKAPTDFGETNDNGVWIPKDYSGTYGTHGFRFEFKQSGTGTDASGMGADTSGNTNHFAVNNLTANDVCTDSPTNNFCTFNSVDCASNITLTEGNTVATANTNHSAVRATIGFRNGKWYWEQKVVNVSGQPAVGILGAEAPLGNQINAVPSRLYRASDGDSGAKYSDGSAANYGDEYVQNDIIGVAVDMDNGAIYFSKNGTFQDSGDPTSGSNKTNAAFTDLLTATSEHWLPAVKLYAEGMSINFGNPSHSISSGNADANGYGNFEYAVPSGYYALCTKNLAEYG